MVVATPAPLYSGPFVEAMSPGDFGGCLDSMLCPRSAVPDRPKMHDNVCKAVVEGVCVFSRTLTVGVIDWGHGADDIKLQDAAVSGCQPISTPSDHF